MLEGNSITALVASFFYQHGYVRIPQLGSFRLQEDLIPGPDGAHRGTFNQDSISFTYNPGEPEDPELISYITERTRKMKSLAVSDLDSLAGQAKEMLNMGQSFTIYSLATLVPDLHGHIGVVPDQVPRTLVSHPNKGHRSVAFQADHSPPPRDGKVYSTGGRRTFGGMLMVAICVVIAGALLYFLFFHHAGQRHPAVAARSGTPSSIPAPDSSFAASGTVAPNPGALHYLAVFEHATEARALARYRQLTSWGHAIILKTSDSVHYALAIEFTTAAADTVAVKDSVSALYGHPVEIRVLPR